MRCASGELCPSMCVVGGLPPSSSQLSPPLLPDDINKNTQLTTKQQVWARGDII